MTLISFLQSRLADFELSLENEKQSNADIRDQLKLEKASNLRLLQQIRALKLDMRKKDKLLTKKNFEIRDLKEKIEILMRSN